jgi:VWFA-related protein
MHARRPVLLLDALVLALLWASAASAQQPGPSAESRDGRIYLDVVAATKSGSPVIGLQQQDFTIFDNNVPQPISSFEAVVGTHAPVEVVIVVDAMNAAYPTVAYERDQIDKFFRADQGDLTYPTSLTVLTDTGLENVGVFSQDGNKLAAALDKYSVRLRFLNRSHSFDGAAERTQISLDGLRALMHRESSRPGRKIFLWVSPGWPLLSGAGVQVDNKMREVLFGDVINLTTNLRRDRITLYTVDPEGTLDSLESDTYWQNFVKGVRKLSQAHTGNLGLEVLSTQSGGAVFSFNNSITAMLRRCIADARGYYELSFVPRAGTAPNQYHRLEIRIAKRGLTARTWQGYYSEPDAQWLPLIPPTASIGKRESGFSAAGD